MIQVNLNENVVQQLLSDRMYLSLIHIKTGVPPDTFLRWLKNKDEKLTLYKVLKALSEVLQIPIDELITVENQ